MKVFFKISTLMILAATLLTSCKMIKFRKQKECDKMKALKSTNANSGCLILNKKNEILMAVKANGQLTIPGGKYDNGENPMQTASREAFEEIGRKVKPKKLLKVYENGYHLFLCTINDKNKDVDPNHKFDKEVIGTKWVNIDTEDSKNLRYPEEYKAIPSMLKGCEVFS